MPTAFSVKTGKRKRKRHLSNTGCRAASKGDGTLFYRGENATGSLAGVSGNSRTCLIGQIKHGSFQLERENEFEAAFHLFELKS